jgi:O-acetyl-ADP-ribose deacetylase (regulator of RNase III)
MIRYVTGDATAQCEPGPKIVAHICNDVGGWGRGFVVAISNRWRAPEEAYRRWFAEGGDSPFALGEVQFVQVAESVWIANMIGQHDTRTIEGVPPVRYDAAEAALLKVAAFAHSRAASVHMPRIGCGLAGGEWGKIEQIIYRTLVEAQVPVFVYDLPAT